jgi:aconitase A
MCIGLHLGKTLDLGREKVRVKGMGLFRFFVIAPATTTNRFYDSVSAEASSIHASVSNPFVPSESAKISKIEPSMRDEKILEDRNI